MGRAFVVFASFAVLGGTCARADVMLLASGEIAVDTRFTIQPPNQVGFNLPEINKDLIDTPPPFSKSVSLNLPYRDADVQMSSTALSSMSSQYGPGQSAQIIASGSLQADSGTIMKGWVGETTNQAFSHEEFTLTSPYYYHLSGLGNVNGDDYGIARIEGALSVYGTNNFIFSWGVALQQPGIPVSNTVDLSGVLGPGSYSFLYSSTTISASLLTPTGVFDASHTATGTETLTLTPVPEPASLTLFGFGISSMAIYSWRRRKARAT
jgi:hypothetical protein